MKYISRIHIGTSGWHYNHWRGPFYPPDAKAEDFLPYYLKHFRTVEINNTFYQLPQKGTLEMWRHTVPAGFIFSVKGSRYITHMKKLKDPEKSVEKFPERVEALGEKLGPILFHLPPRWKLNPERLRAFLEALPGKYRYALEFRDPSWFSDKTYRILQKQGAAFCIYELSGFLSPKEVTADFVYVRLHGPKGPYQGQYGIQVLAGWAGAFSAWVKEKKEIFCYFDNDEAGYAAQDALKLQEMTAELAGGG
ncbi:MAG: DUF72 domain-containing protein [Proteobacteria bacterium]|nr:DUF72 domain-containing protein [Pseudomonadota bacterium]